MEFENLPNMINRIKANQFYMMMTELELFPKYENILRENGFDEWTSIVELSPDILREIGVGDSLDNQQILACINAAESIKLNLDEVENKNILEENYEEYEDFNEEEEREREREYVSATKDNGGEIDEADETLGIEMKKKFFNHKKMLLSIRVLEKASYQKAMKNERIEEFSYRIISLYLMNKGYEQMVNI